MCLPLLLCMAMVAEPLSVVADEDSSGGFYGRTGRCGANHSKCACLEETGDGNWMPNDDCCASPGKWKCAKGFVMGPQSDNPCYGASHENTGGPQKYYGCCRLDPGLQIDGKHIGCDGSDNDGSWIALLVGIIYGVIVLVYCVGGCAAAFICAPKQKFSTPLKGCLNDMETCVVTMICPCVTWARVASQSGAFKGSSKPPTANIYDVDAMFCLIYACCSHFHCCLGIVSREHLRQAYNINGDCMADCMIHTFAHQCALCQEMRELKQRGAPPRQQNGMVPLGAGLVGGMAMAVAVPMTTMPVMPVETVSATQVNPVMVDKPAHPQPSPPQQQPLRGMAAEQGTSIYSQ